MRSTRSPRPLATITVLVAMLAASACASAQQTPPQPGRSLPPTPPQAAQQPATQRPATAPGERTDILAEVIEVHGDVKAAALDSKDWKPVQLGDRLPPQTKLLTGIRSSVKLRIGEEEPYTALLIEQVGLTVLSEAFKTADTKTVRVGVGYGRVRAGVAAGGLKSEFSVDSPVATLSKRGTWGFTLFYERGTDFFEIGLADVGIIEALNKLTAERRKVEPHELVNTAMRMWLDQAAIVRNVSVVDMLGQSDIELAFNRLDTDGLGVLNPGQGRAVVLNLSNASAQQTFASMLERSLGPVSGTVSPPSGAVLRPEGFFGTGRGDELIEVLIETTNPLAQKGLARPGRYLFRRSAAEAWLQQHRHRP